MIDFNFAEITDDKSISQFERKFECRIFGHYSWVVITWYFDEMYLDDMLKHLPLHKILETACEGYIQKVYEENNKQPYDYSLYHV